MIHVLQALQPLFDRFGYLAVFLTIFLEDFGLPTPGETTLVLASLLAARGGLSIYALSLTAWIAAVIGDNVGYTIGRFAARSLILRIARLVFIGEKKVLAAENAFRKWGPFLVAVARFVEILRQLNGILAGMARMRWRRFFVFNALGAASWVAFWATLAYELGRATVQPGALFQHLDVLFIALFALTVISFVLWKLFTRRRGASTAGTGSTDTNRTEATSPDVEVAAEDVEVAAKVEQSFDPQISG